MSNFYNIESLKTISKKEVPATMRLARVIYKKDKKTGIEKDSKGLHVAAIMTATVQMIAADSNGLEWMQNAIAGVQDSVIRKLVDSGKLVINEEEISFSAIINEMKLANESSGARFSKEAIATWYAEYMLNPLSEAICNKMQGISESQLKKFIDNYLASFQILAGRNPTMSNEVKASLIRAMEFLPEDHDSVVAITIAERLAAITEASAELLAL